MKFPNLSKHNLFQFKKKGSNRLENYSYDLESYYNSTRPKKKTSSLKKSFFRVVIAVAIFLVVLTLRQTDHPVAVQAREGIKYVLTTEWNFAPAFDKAIQVGMKAVNLDVPFFNDLPNTQPVLAPTVNSEYSLPVSGKIVKKYGLVEDPVVGVEFFNSGIDISTTPGTKVKAARAGKVVKVGENENSSNFILIAHGQEVYTFYGDLDTVAVKENQQVKAEESIGTVGQDGVIQPAGLHFEIRENNKLVDPLSKLRINDD